MIRNNAFEIVKIADEYLAVPVGEEAISSHCVVSLSEPASFLLNQMTGSLTKEELLDLLLKEYEVDRTIVETELDAIMKTFTELKLVLDE